MTRDDLDWAVDVLAGRRAALVSHAPLYWRPAADALERHRDFLAYLLEGEKGFGFRTDRALMIGAKGSSSWTVDDAWVEPDRWEDDGAELWARMIERVDTAPVHVVCPVAEPERADFFGHRGLVLARSWWHVDAGPSTAGRVPAATPHLAGTRATLVPAPPVYDPGGPVLFIEDVHDVTSLAGSREEAARCGSPLVVVDQPSSRADVARALAVEGFIRHCDFLVGAVDAAGRISLAGSDLDQVQRS